MTTEALKSTGITNLDSVPVVQNTTGENGPGFERIIIGVAAPVLLTVGSTYRLLRLPTSAKVKAVVVATDKALDSNSSNTLAIDFNIAFSDSTMDGTAASNQGNIPTTANTGAVTTVASYSSPNILFGTVTPASHTAALAKTDITFNGTNYTMLLKTETPLWQIFGFSVDPGGMFDLLAYVSTAAATAVTTGHLYAEVKYIE